MGGVRVIEPGVLTTVQDLGRPGWSAIGVAPGGAADALSLRIGNRLVGNEDGAPALEMTLVGATLLFERDATIALVGGDVPAASIGGSGAVRNVPRGRPVIVRAGETLRTGPIVRGVRAYVCIAAGVRVARVLASASTHLAAGFGGVQGRALRKGDSIEIGTPPDHPLARAGLVAGAGLIEESLARRTLHAVAGAHAPSFDPAAIESFWATEFIVAPQSDRVGLRLQGRIGGGKPAGGMPSEGMMHGAVQVPESGEPIVLMCDHPTTGGYPVIVCVATVDLPTLGQLRPGDKVRFEQVSLATARELFTASGRRLNLAVPPRPASPHCFVAPEKEIE